MKRHGKKFGLFLGYLVNVLHSLPRLIYRYQYIKNKAEDHREAKFRQVFRLLKIVQILC